MDSVLTLVTPSPGELTSAIVADAIRTLNGLGAETAEPTWLSPSEAAEIAFNNVPVETAEIAVRDALTGIAMDMAAVPALRRRKRLLLADMDSTIVTSETLDDLAEFARLKDRIAEITARAMNGEIEFEAAVKERVGMLAGLAEETLAATYEKIRLTTGAETLVRTMRAAGAYCVLVSGGFTFFTSRVSAACGFHEHHANRFVIADGRLTGEVVEPILNKDAKLEQLRRLTRDRDLHADETLCVGDGANDLPMILAAGMGVAFHGKPIVAAEAPARVDHGDLTTLLFYQGFSRAEFLSA